MTDTGTIRTHLADDGCCEITIDRADEGNVLTHAMTEALGAAFRAPPEGARFVLLSAAGADFCAGRVSPMPKPGVVMTAEALRHRVAEPVLAFYAAVRSTPLPVIVAVRGRAHGVGCALAGLGDVVLADDTADFRIPEMNRDIPPLLVGTALADRVSRAGLARLIFSREPLDAAAAVQIGLASEACASGELDGRIAAYRSALSANGATSLATVKRFLNLAADSGFEVLREYAASANSAAASERFVAPSDGASR